MNKVLISMLFLLISLSISHAHSFDIVWSGNEDQVDTFVLSNFEFPQNFLWGAATSAYQIEGAAIYDNKYCENNWTRDPKKAHAGISCDHWNRYKEDIQLMKQAGLNAYRLSIEWSKVEPAQNIFDERAMQHYSDVCDELLKYGITPIVCLFHHTWPVWFDKKGAFEYEENCDDFVQFADYVFEKLNKKVQIWMTFNEPVGFVMEGYLRGTYPPYKKGALLDGAKIALSGRVLKNMLNTHVRIYQHFKQKNNDAIIGFPKVMNPLEPYHPWNPVERLICAFFSYLLHDVTINFFKTGLYNWAFIVKDYNELAPTSLDYLGVNYYTHTLLCQKITGGLSEQSRPTEILSDNGKALYPQGLAWSIKKAAECGKPLIITENGISTNNDELRDRYMREHLFVVCKALKAGFDIRGYFVWSLMDTYGWRNGFSGKSGYGLYHVDFNNGLTRTLREGAKPFVTFMQQESIKKAQIV